jgi:hypothetical protein
MQCSQCGVSNVPEAQLCEACGHAFSPEVQTCRDCGTINVATARFCNHCGHALTPAIAPAPARSRRNYLAAAGGALVVVVLVVLAMTVGSAPAPLATSTATPAMIHVLAVLLASVALGGAIACGLLIEGRWRRTIVSAAIGVVAVLFFDSVPTRPFTGNIPGDILAGIFGTCFTTFLASAFFDGWTFGFSGPEIRANLRAILLPQSWTDIAVTEPLPPRDLVSRWFVTVAASTGSVVGALMTQPDFWHAMARALAPTRLIFTLLLTVVSITLIGPLEEYIFGRRVGRRGSSQGNEPHAAARGLFEDVWENFSPRAAGRLMLVLLFSFQPALLDACVGETVSRGDINATFLILTSAIGPALITYYWSAALQRGAPSVMHQAGRSSTVLSAILWYPPCFVLLMALAFALVQSDPQNNGKFMIIAFLLGIPLAYGIALAWGFLLNGLMAYGGGWVLDRVRAQREMDTLKAVVMLGAVLAVINLLLFAATMLALVAVGGDEAHIGLADWAQTMLGLLSTVGWVGGLVVSGFPKILHTARERPPPAAAGRRCWCQAGCHHLGSVPTTGDGP